MRVRVSLLQVMVRLLQVLCPTPERRVHALRAQRQKSFFSLIPVLVAVGQTCCREKPRRRCGPTLRVLHLIVDAADAASNSRNA